MLYIILQQHFNTSELDLNTDAQETICILKNIIEINDYVEEEKIADATAGFNMFDHISIFFLPFFPRQLARNKP